MLGVAGKTKAPHFIENQTFFLWRGIPNFLSFPIFTVKCGLWYEARPEGPGPNTQAREAEHTLEWQKIKYLVCESKVPTQTRHTETEAKQKSI